MAIWNRSAALLLALTIVAFSLGHADGLAPPMAGGATLGIAWYKGRLVILDFMELRQAPPLWRRLAEGWVITVSAILGLVYFFGA